MRPGIVPLFLSICLGILSCDEEDDNEVAGATTSTGTLQLGVKSVQSPNSSDTSLTLNASDAPFRNYSMASGKPDELNLTIYRILLNPPANAADKTARPIFADSAGKTIAITKSRVDLSSMFTNFSCVDNNGVPFDLEDWYNNEFPTIDNTYENGDPVEYRQWTSLDQASCECGFDKNNYPLGPNASGECPPMESGSNTGGQTADLSIAEGTYSTVTVYYKRKATVKGCVSGYFFETWGQTDNTVEKSTFCTRKDHAYFNTSGGGTYTDFEDKTSELVDIDLSGAGTFNAENLPGSGDGLDANDVVRIEFPIPGNVTIASDATAQLTLLIDTNRMLQFYSDHHSAITNSGEGRGAGPGALTGKSYFFTSIFEDSQFFFVGRPGNIYGFEMLTLPCTTTDKSVLDAFSQPSDYACTSSDDEGQSLWMTVIEDADANIISATIQPDDGLSYVALKGDNINITSGENGSIEYEWGKNWQTNTDGSWNITYGLYDSNQSPPTQSLLGTIYNVNKSSTIGSDIPNVYFHSTSSTGETPSYIYGTVTMKRQL